MSNQLQIEVESINPARAVEYLELNKCNRPLKQGHVDFLAREMTKGDWRMAGDPIRFSDQGNLLDGQHRLMALMHSNKTLDFVVMKGLEQKTIEVMDTGSRERSPGDVFAMRGESHYNLLAAVINHASWFLKTGTLVRGSDSTYASRLSMPEYDRILKAYPQIREIVANRAGASKRGLPLPVSTAAGFEFLFGLSDYTVSSPEAFWHSFETGENLGHGNPILVLRNKLIRLIAEDAPMLRMLRMWHIIKAWNFVQAEKTVTRIWVQPKEKEFPTIVNYPRQNIRI